MPELPEVEVVRRGVELHAVGRTLERAVVHHPRAVRRHLPGAADLESRLAGRRLMAARRRGKYLWFDLDGDPVPDESLVLHLGMSGQVLVQPAGHSSTHPHLRVELLFDDGGPDLWFVDQRTFGGLALEPLLPVAPGADETVPASVAHIARDPLDPAYDVGSVVEALRRKDTGLKRALLDQTLVSGIGNIYADEALWRARLHGARSTRTLRRTEARRVLDAAAEVMREALGQGGTSFDALYVDVNGESGYFDRSLAAYGQAGEPCPRCGTPIRRDAFMNRSSYSCPHCQPRPRNPHW
ncbi:bifunctional DNA-formamidopyrimidine glycosylase/DNA-(apurinic or apyrimidinic site) lyase [Angustibacter sp. McL0619]|uniref:bifunctional DNA-formamidopyrimidine glycosylase/DNA-(apurinic or apyrimidinic site) lyase n=1 Tax=Angustibacter sp. McL0619 TaxID=3415676 RepID=UPI003CE9C5B2